MRFVLASLLLLATSAASAQVEEDAAHRADRLRTEQLNRDAAAAIARRDRANADLLRRDQARNEDQAYRETERRYRAARAQYERELADWRERVAACRAGYYDACD